MGIGDMGYGDPIDWAVGGLAVGHGGVGSQWMGSGDPGCGDPIMGLHARRPTGTPRIPPLPPPQALPHIRIPALPASCSLHTTPPCLKVSPPYPPLPPLWGRPPP